MSRPNKPHSPRCARLSRKLSKQFKAAIPPIKVPLVKNDPPPKNESDSGVQKGLSQYEMSNQSSLIPTSYGPLVLSSNSLNSQPKIEEILLLKHRVENALRALNNLLSASYQNNFEIPNVKMPYSQMGNFVGNEDPNSIVPTLLSLLNRYPVSSQNTHMPFPPNVSTPNTQLSLPPNGYTPHIQMPLPPNVSTPNTHMPIQPTVSIPNTQLSLPPNVSTPNTQMPLPPNIPTLNIQTYLLPNDSTVGNKELNKPETKIINSINKLYQSPDTQTKPSSPFKSQTAGTTEDESTIIPSTEKVSKPIRRRLGTEMKNPLSFSDKVNNNGGNNEKANLPEDNSSSQFTVLVDPKSGNYFINDYFVDNNLKLEENRETFTKELLDAHNKYRKLHNVDPLKLDDEMTEYSQWWADKLLDMNPNIQNTKTVPHSPEDLRKNKQYGENLFWAKVRYVPGNLPVESWYAEGEKVNYKYGNDQLTPGAAHFTQLLWKGSQYIGVGVAGDETHGIYVVCNYKSMGNVAGHYKENVLPPTRPTSR